MATLIEFKGTTSDVMFVPRPIDDTALGVGAVGAGVDVVEQAGETLTQALAVIGEVADAIGSAIAQAKIEEAEATIGLTVTAKGKFVVAEVTGEASISVKIKIKPKA